MVTVDAVAEHKYEAHCECGATVSTCATSASTTQRAVTSSRSPIETRRDVLAK